MTDARRLAECVHGAIETYPGTVSSKGKSRCHNCGTWLIDPADAVAQAVKEQSCPPGWHRIVCDQLQIDALKEKVAQQAEEIARLRVALQEMADVYQYVPLTPVGQAILDRAREALRS